MPFRPCYPRVGPLPEPDVCYSCVGRRSRSAVAPAPRTRRACPRPEDRPPPGTDFVSRPSSYLCGQAENDAPGRNETYTDEQITHNADYELVDGRSLGPVPTRI